MEGDLQRIFGENLRAYREARSMSQEAFADFGIVQLTEPDEPIRSSFFQWFHLSAHSAKRVGALVDGIAATYAGRQHGGRLVE